MQKLTRTLSLRGGSEQRAEGEAACAQGSVGRHPPKRCLLSPSTRCTKDAQLEVGPRRNAVGSPSLTQRGSELLEEELLGKAINSRRDDRIAFRISLREPRHLSVENRVAARRLLLYRNGPAAVVRLHWPCWSRETKARFQARGR